MSLTDHHHPFPGAAADTADHELQTDIMRFLAILALCLMAVFALVQGLPRTPAQTLPDPRAELLAEVQSLQAQTQRLHAEQQALQETLQRMREQKARVLATLDQARHRVEQARGVLEQAEREKDATLDALAQAERQLETSEYRLRRSAARLDRMEQDLQQKTRSLEQVGQRKAAEARELAGIEQRLEQLRRGLVSAEPDPVEPAVPSRREVAAAPPHQETTAAVETRAGFTLRFASEQALRRLVASGRVRLYARAERAFWRLRIGGGKERFETASAPGAYYEMTPQTVPASFVAALARRAGQSATTWGVTLPAPTESRLRELMSAHRGGALVIGPDGKVELEPEGRT